MNKMLLSKISAIAIAIITTIATLMPTKINALGLKKCKAWEDKMQKCGEDAYGDVYRNIRDCFDGNWATECTEKLSCNDRPDTDHCPQSGE